MNDLLEMREISKVYTNGVYANQLVNFSVKKGEIHALVGENGAGKSTLMKVLYGLEKPDHGEIILNGISQNFQSPHDAMDKGIGMVHQHFMLVESFTVTENVILGFEPVEKGFINKGEARKRVIELADKFNLKINPDAKVKDLPVGTKQKVEILKALYRGAKILILDEPTAVLTPQETEELFAQFVSLKNHEFTVIFITHKLREVKEISDRISIMRLGKMINTIDTNKISEFEISELMVGSGYSIDIGKTKVVPKENVLCIEGLTLVDKNRVTVVDNVSFSVRSGEIVGIAGVEGNGQDKLTSMITGLLRKSSGNVKMFGNDINKKPIGKLREEGLAYIPSDRMVLGVAAPMTIEENLISTKMKTLELTGRFKLLKTKKIREVTENLVKVYFIKCKSTLTEVEMLSGGNIQKVVIAREFSQENVKLIVAEQPTRGIDVGAAKFIHRKLVELRDSGCAILLISADLEELYNLSDSILVLYKGKFSAYIEDPSKVNEKLLGRFMLGVENQSEEQIRRAYHD